LSEKIAAYGMVGDNRTAALISAKGEVSWLCWPEFDSEACFASLLGSPENGVWSLAPHSFRTHSRRYLPGTLVIETTYSQLLGATVTVTDFMPPRDGPSCLVRIVRGVKGSMRFTTRFAPRFDYGSVHPWIKKDKQKDGRWAATSGPNRITLDANVDCHLGKEDLVADWVVKAGETYHFTCQYSHSFADTDAENIDALAAERSTIEHWTHWISRNSYNGAYKAAVDRSLVTLKALTYQPSGGFVAAPTTSLPEKVGGIRNWDYRFCWLRDTTFSLLGLLHCGYIDDAQAWLAWLSRSLAGNPDAIKIMYGIAGKREHSEWSANWLTGYENSKPVHIGNKASDQLQLDTFGEVMDTLYRARCHGLYPLKDRSGEAIEIPLLEHLEKVWTEPDEGLWEFRSGRRQFTESKVMAWVAFDRGIRMIEKFGIKGPLERWQKVRSAIHAQVCKLGFHKGMHSFTQSYGTRHLDSSLLLLPLVGFLPIDDPRITGTVKAVEKHLKKDGLLLRYNTRRVDDGLPPGEGAFLACSFWLVEVYILQGRMQEATELFEKLLAISNDLTLLSEEYDSKHGLIGNFPQAFSHIGLINAALGLHLGVPVRLHDLE
jgi:GH15 family glucan-1,4-alpha-glucosidase